MKIWFFSGALTKKSSVCTVQVSAEHRKSLSAIQFGKYNI